MTASWPDFVRVVPDRMLAWILVQRKWREIYLMFTFFLVSNFTFATAFWNLGWEAIAGVSAGLTVLVGLHLKVMSLMINSAFQKFLAELTTKEMCLERHGNCREEVFRRISVIEHRHVADDDALRGER